MKKIFALVAIVLVFSACKKDEVVPLSGGNSLYTVSTSSVYSGAFIAGNYTVTNSYGTSTSSDMRVSFYTPPKANKMISPGIEIRSVKLNGEDLMYDHGYQYYFKDKWNLDNEQVWNVVGARSITSFNMHINNPTPSCQDFKVIPDSVSLGDGFTLNIPGVSNVTLGARVIIYDGNYNEVTSKPVVNGDNSISFSSSDFAYFGAEGFILIQLENNAAYNFNSQDFIFVEAKGFMKEVKFRM